MATPRVSEASLTPYVSDGNTTYLFHFDEPAGASVANNSGLAGYDAVAYEGAPFSGVGVDQPVSTSVLGAGGFAGFGLAADLSVTNTLGLGVDVSGNGAFMLDESAPSPSSADRLSNHATIMGVENAFTLEALVNLASITGANREIIATDNGDTSDSQRGFQFRINTSGGLEFNFVGVNISAISQSIPTSGPHAFVPGVWFHAAMAYNGTGATFYWTRLDAAVTQANALNGSPIPEGVDLNDDALLVIGNEGRASAGGSSEGLLGLIDEVRISDVARSAGEFYWQPADLAPYVEDADTLHLWHLDEAGAPALDEVGGGTPLNGLLGGASLNNDSFAGFGSALGIGGSGEILLAAPALSASSAGSGADSVDLAMADPASGALTWEAILRLDFDPTESRSDAMQIICGEGEGTPGASDSDRQWQFRLDPVGFAGPAGSAINRLRIEFHNFNGAAYGNPVWANVPDAGPHAALSNGWYHVALVYDGNEATLDNVSFYWTKLGPSHVAANFVGSGQVLEDLKVNNNGATDGNINADFSVGNDARNSFGENEPFIGLIDEIRISRVARGATNFYWPTSVLDQDEDGLPDSWETFYFPDITSYGATNDPDGDSYDNLAEYNGGSNPTYILSTPLDTDADSIPDAWEYTYFGSLTYGPTDDPDGDGYDNATERAAGTNPNNPASNPSDTDADGLPDAWETQYFGSLSEGPLDDFDNDGFTNGEEYQAGSLPDDINSVPENVYVRYFPIEDGDTNTSEYGFAGSSAINAVAFVKSALVTVSNRQFIAYYGRHQTDPSYAFNNTIWIARRTIGSNIWEVFRTSYMANNINDGHDVVCFAFDGDGYMHMSWGMHGDAFHYSRSTTPVSGGQPVVMGPDVSMTGDENSVTYPQWLTLPDGDLLYLYREGASGAGDTYLNRYHHVAQTWTNVHYSGGQQPFIRGRGWSPDYNAYPNMPCLDALGNLFLSWTWRYNSDSPAGESGYQTNHDFDYAHSTDGGLTWRRQDDTPYALPISESGESGNPDTMAEKIVSVPEGYSLINQTGMCLDELGNPVIASWWAPGTATNNYRRQYMVAFPDEHQVWQVRQVSNRTNDPEGTKFSESAVRDLGRPVVVCDPVGRLIVLYRDDFNDNGLTIAHSLPRGVDPDRLLWITFDLTTDNLGNYEPVIDLARWEQSTVLSILYQPSSGQGYSPPANTASEVGVLEWDAGSYFEQVPELQLISVVMGGDATLSFPALPSWGYRLNTTTNLSEPWQTVSSWNGSNGMVTFNHVGGGDNGQRFWLLEYQEGGVPME